MFLANCNGLIEITPGEPETYIDTKRLYVNLSKCEPKTCTSGKIVIFALKGAFRDPLFEIPAHFTPNLLRYWN